MQRPYELMLVISPGVQDEAVTPLLDRVNKFITDRGGTVETQDHWGRRKMAYPINRHLEGNYVLTHFQLEQPAVSELEATLRLNEEILRHLVVRRDA